MIELIFQPAHPGLEHDSYLATAMVATNMLGYVAEHRYGGPQEPIEVVFLSASRPASEIHFIDNPQLRCKYFSIDGPDAASVRRALEAQLAGLVYDRDSYERATTDPELDERVTALFHLALARGPVPEPHVQRLLPWFLEHANHSVRRSAVLACAYFEWPDVVIPLLDQLIQRDLDTHVLDDARLVRGRLKPELSITGYERLVVHEGAHSETIWVRRWTDGRYVISCIPQVVNGISLDDIVEVEPREGTNVMARVLEKRGHRTLRVDIDASDDRLEALRTQHRVRIESQHAGRIAIDASLEVDVQALEHALDQIGVFWECSDPAPR